MVKGKQGISGVCSWVMATADGYGMRCGYGIQICRMIINKIFENGTVLTEHRCQRGIAQTLVG
jgi:hypothetical protein